MVTWVCVPSGFTRVAMLLPSGLVISLSISRPDESTVLDSTDPSVLKSVEVVEPSLLTEV